MPSNAGAIRAGRAFVELFADDSRLVRGLRAAQRRLQAFSSFATGLGSKLLGGASVIATPFLFAVKAASDLQEQMNKFEVVFGKNSKAVEAWADNFKNEVGRSKRQIVEFLAGSQDLLVPLGIDPKTATDMSKTLTGLAVDLASFNNMQDADTMRDLQAALTGSSETMLKYGVIVNEAAVKQELLNSKIDPKKATDAQKVMARLNIILRGTSAAQGDAVRSGTGFANMWKRFQSTAEDAAAAVGTALLPTLSELLGKAAGVVVRFAEWAGKNQGLILTIVKVVAVVAAIGTGLIAAGVAASALNAIIGLGITLWTGIGVAIGAVGALLGALLSPIGAVVAGVVALSSFFIDWGKVAGDTTKAAGDSFNNFRERATSAWGGIRDAIASGDLGLAFKIVTLFLKTEWLRIISVLQSKWNAFTGFFQSVWANAVFGAARILTNAWASLQTTWAKFTGVLADGWTMFTGFIQRTWNTTVGFLRKAWEKLKEKVTGKKGTSSSDIDRETQAANRAVQAEVDQRIAARERERKARLDEIEGERNATLEALDEEQRRREQEREDAASAELEENESKLNDARAELAKAIADAQKKRKAKEEEDERLAGKAPGEGAGQTKFDPSKLAANGAVAEKAAVEGTITGFDRFAGFGARDNADRQRKQMLDKLNEIATNTRQGRTVRVPNL